MSKCSSGAISYCFEEQMEFDSEKLREDKRNGLCMAPEAYVIPDTRFFI